MRKPKRSEIQEVFHDKVRVAILVDGGFYRKRSYAAFGEKSPQDRAVELDSYCRRHLHETINNVVHEHDLYRIFYYDCEPSSKAVFNPITKKNDELSKSGTYTWTNDFLAELKKKRKFAVRLGEISDSGTGYFLPIDITKQLLTGKKTLEQLTVEDLTLMVNQKGVDMRIGLDIASMTFKKQVDQIVLISGDSDFVPAAKLARREGIDFVLDPLGAKVKENLMEHIDGLKTVDPNFKTYKAK